MPAPGQEETVRIVALDRDFHVQCYRCEVCSLCVYLLWYVSSIISSGGFVAQLQVTVIKA